MPQGGGERGGGGILTLAAARPADSWHVDRVVDRGWLKRPPGVALWERAHVHRSSRRMRMKLGLNVETWTGLWIYE